MTYDLFGNVISSPESEAGRSPFAAPAGRTSAPSGPLPALASLSARQAEEAGLLTSGTYGPPSTISPRNRALMSSLASRLHRKTASLGSTLYRLTWRRRHTPAGRSISALRASARPTSDSGSTLSGWTTPQAHDTNKRGAGNRDNPKGGGACLAWDASLAGWATPTTRDWKSGGGRPDQQPHPEGRKDAQRPARLSGVSGGVARANGGDASAERLQRGGEHGQRTQDDGAGGVANAPRRDQRRHGGGPRGSPNASEGEARAPDGNAAGSTGAMVRPGPANGFWRAADWIFCTDDKWRPVEPGTFPLASGIPGRVALLRGAGNAVNVEVAAGFVGAVMSMIPHSVPPAQERRG